MTRPPRVHFEGAFYHITARGNNKEAVFFDDQDREKYLFFLKRYKSRSDFRLHAYALLPNHVHLLVETGKDPISKIMQALHTSYTMYFNIKYGRVGHLFQGRFNSLLCDRDAYLLELIRYIHLNPIRAGLAKNLKDYKWTSHAEYLGKRRLIDSEMVLEMLGGTQGYMEFLRVAINRPDCVSFPDIKKQIFIGDPSFIEAARSQSNQLEVITKPVVSTCLPKVVSEVADFFDLSTEDILGKRKTQDISLARNIAIYLIRVSYKAGLKETAHLFSYSSSSICHSVAIIEKKMEKTVFKKVIALLKENLKNLDQ